MWKSVPYFLSKIWNSSIYYYVQTFDFYLLSVEWLLDIESVSLKVDLTLGFFWIEYEVLWIIWNQWDFLVLPWVD